MNTKKVFCLLAALALSALLTGCSPEKNASTVPTDVPQATDAQAPSEEGDTLTFRPVDCGVQPQESYEYPFIGLTVRLSEGMRALMDSREVFVLQDEAYTEELAVDYALMRFYATTEEQRSLQVASFDLYAWEEQLEKLGALGVYRKERAEQLDELTGCDRHTKLGESADGAYEYYLSARSTGNEALVKELQATQATLSEIRPMDMEYGDSAFAVGRVEDVATVGEFTTQDVFGETWTQELFADYDLTLVNAFATWCSPCVQEMPELEELRQTLQEEGVRFHVVGVVLDTVVSGQRDEAAIEQAKLLHEKTGVQFPYLIPDETEMNGRVKGLAVVPESFFVDSQGRIVSDPYLGARPMEAWKVIVKEELAKLEAAQ